MTLATEISNLGLVGDEAVLAYFNSKTILVKGSVTTSAIKQYLTLKGLRVAIKNGNSLACQEVMLALADFESFDCSNPVVLAVLTAVLDDLIADSLVPAFTIADKEAILGMADKLISPAESLGLEVNFETVAQALRG